MPPLVQPKSHPWVYSATITGDKITFSVEVTDFKPDAGVIEISGQATQVGGAFAPINAIAQVPAEPNGNPGEGDERGRSFVDVVAEPTPDHSFRKDQDVTVFVRVSQAWVTVLGAGEGEPNGTPELTVPDEKANEGQTWAKHKADARISKQ
jgi:hypothetical protein